MRLDSFAGSHVVEGTARHLAVPLKALDGEKDIALYRVGHPAPHQYVDRLDYVFDVLGGKAQDVGRAYPQRLHISLEGPRVLLRHAICGYALHSSTLDDAVVHICVVSCIGHVVASICEIPTNEVEP